MNERELLVTCVCRQLEGTDRYYIAYIFASHWRLEHLRVAMQEGSQWIAQRPVDETFESFFVFTESESFDAVNLISEMRRTFSHPDNKRFTHTSVVGLQGFAHDLIGNLLDIARRFYRDQTPRISFYSTFDEALSAMRERIDAAK